MKWFWLFLGLFLTGFDCMAQDQPLSIDKVTSLVLSNDTSVLKALEILRSASSKYNLLLANGKPQLALSTGYSHSYSNYLVNSSGYELSDFSVDTVSMGLSVKQLLGTYGTLSLNVSDQLYSYNGNVAYYYDPFFVPFAYGPFFGQSPVVSLALDQLLFFNNKLLETDLFKSVFRQGEISSLEAAEQNRIAQNEAIYETIKLLFEVVKFRNDLSAITKAVELKQTGVENLERSLKAGLVAELDVWEMRVEEGREKENLLSCEYTLKQKEGDLKAILGLDSQQALTIGQLDLDSSLSAPAQDQPAESAFSQNPAVRISEMELENARLKRIIDGASYASSLNLTVDFTPHYSELRPYLTSKANIWDSFTDFWDADSGWTASMSVSLNVPLYNGSKAKHQAVADDASEAALREEVTQQKRELLLKIQMTLQMEQNLQERIARMTDNILLKKKQAEVTRGLVKVGQKAELEVIKVEIDSMQMENELAAANMDLYLTRLYLRALMGEDLEKAIR